MNHLLRCTSWLGIISLLWLILKNHTKCWVFSFHIIHIWSLVTWSLNTTDIESFLDMPLFSYSSQTFFQVKYIVTSLTSTFCLSQIMQVKIFPLCTDSLCVLKYSSWLNLVSHVLQIIHFHHEQITNLVGHYAQNHQWRSQYFLHEHIAAKLLS